MIEDLDTSQYDAYVAELARLLRVELPDVIDHETASVMRIAASRHKPSKAGDIRQQTRLRLMANARIADSILTVNVKTNRGRIWFNPDRGKKGKWQIIGHWDMKSANYAPAVRRMSKVDYAKAKKVWKVAKREARTASQIGIKSRGLSGKSWIKIIKLMGMAHENIGPKSAKIPTYVPTSMARTGREYNNERVYRRKHADGYSVTIVNSAPITLRNRGRANLQNAINRRRAFFVKNLKEGALDNAASAATRYPGIFYAG